MRPAARCALLVAGCLAACIQTVQAQPSPARVQSVARQAYVYGYPMVDLYRIYYQFFINDQSAEHRHLTNKVYNAPGLLTPDNTTLQSPDADVLYSFALLDLRAQPIVVTLPGVAKNRYYSLQFVDQYTFNIGYAGTRATGNGGGRFLVIGPGWKGTAPQGIKSVIHADTQFVLVVLRTQVFGPDDLPDARKVQAGFHVDDLSAYAHSPVPRSPARVHWLLPLSADAQTRGLDFFNLLAFVAQFCPIDQSERGLWKSFGTIGIAPGKRFDSSTMPIDEIKALRMGMTVGQLDILGQRQKLTSSIGVFGDRKQLGSNYLLRAAGAQLGILGNSAQETLSYVVIKDPNRMALSGLLSRYTIRFARSTASGERVLVAHPVSDPLTPARPKPAEQVFHRLADAVEADARPRWRLHHLPPVSISRRQLGGELVACARGALLSHPAPVLPKAAGAARVVETANDPSAAVSLAAGAGTRVVISGSRHYQPLVYFRDTERYFWHMVMPEATGYTWVQRGTAEMLTFPLDMAGEPTEEDVLHIDPVVEYDRRKFWREWAARMMEEAPEDVEEIIARGRPTGP